MPRTSIRRGPSLLAGLTLLAVLCYLCADRKGGAASEPEQLRDKTASLRVPDGFVVELVAGPPLVEHPMMACFDERGRLFVADSAGKNLKAEDLLRDPPSCIRVLEDVDGDGRFDRSSVFADKLTFPMGVLWHDGAVYTASPPSLWKLEDAAGKGTADRRTELVTRFGFTGNAADIHGPFLGPDGRFYWTDGRHGHDIKKPDGSVLKGQAARIFRCQPDGSDVEVVCGGGMDDPVEIAFTPEGEALATVDIFIGRPSRIDAIIHCVEGGVFPYHEVYKEFKSTGDLLPAAIELGWVAPAGLMRYRDTAFGPAYRNNLFSAQFNRQRVQRHVLERDGATFRGNCADFLVSSDPDFHATDVLEDADGSLLVIDTGGWFRIGCPESKIAKPDVKGGIYRIRRREAAKVADPRGLKLPWNELAPDALTRLLDDGRFAVRDRAVATLGKRGSSALPALQAVLARSASPVARRNAVWALTRMAGVQPRNALVAALHDQDDSVRQAAAHAVGLLRDENAGAQLTEMVRHDSAPPVRREAATALGRLRRPQAVPALLDGIRTDSDRFLEHVLIFALLEIADPTATRRGLGDPSPQVRRAALLALDQMEKGALTRAEAAAALDTSDPSLQRTALAVIRAHPGWAGETTALLKDWLHQGPLDEVRRELLRGALLAFCQDAAVQDLVAEAILQPSTPAATRLLLLEAMARAPLEKLPRRWIVALGSCLEDANGDVLRQALACVRTARLAEFDAILIRLAGDEQRPAAVRAEALATLAPRLKTVEESWFRFLLGSLAADVGPLERLAAARTLGSLPLSDKQRQATLPAVARAGSLELPSLLVAFEGTRSNAVGRELVMALGKSPGLESLTPNLLRRTFVAYPREVQAQLAPLFKRLAVDADQQATRLAELRPLQTGGDAARGRAVFFGKKASCFACHLVQGEGGRIGPDLTTIGAIRSGPDLLEAIVFPSASFARGYEPYNLTTRQGQSYTGVIARDSADAVVLVLADRSEVRVPRTSIETLERGRVSIMPQGLEQSLSREELRDLLAFLTSLR